MNKNLVHWDPVNLEYPVRNFPSIDETTNEIRHDWRGQPEVLYRDKVPEDIKQFEYSHNHDIGKDLYRSQSIVDFGFKHPDSKRFIKHNSCLENEYLYPSSRQLETGTSDPASCLTTETRNMLAASKIKTPPATLVMEKEQFRRNIKNYKSAEPSWHKQLPPLDTTHEGYEIYLDPYLTTSRLHHRPFTAHQLQKSSASKNIMTYYTCADVSWVRTPKPGAGDWWLRRNIHKSMYDREKFKQDFREIRVHNKATWVSGSFRTENRDNYRPPGASIGFRSLDIEDDTKAYYQKSVAALPSNIADEDLILLKRYNTETKDMNQGKPLCATLYPYTEINKRQLK